MGRKGVKSVSIPRTCRQSALFIILHDFPPIRLQARGLIMGPPRPHIGYTLRGWRAGGRGNLHVAFRWWWTNWPGVPSSCVISISVYSVGLGL